MMFVCAIFALAITGKDIIQAVISFILSLCLRFFFFFFFVFFFFFFFFFFFVVVFLLFSFFVSNFISS